MFAQIIHHLSTFFSERFTSHSIKMTDNVLFVEPQWFSKPHDWQIELNSHPLNKDLQNTHCMDGIDKPRDRLNIMLGRSFQAFGDAFLESFHCRYSFNQQMSSVCTLESLALATLSKHSQLADQSFQDH